jgi:putative DNA primase/helicase
MTKRDPLAALDNAVREAQRRATNAGAQANDTQCPRPNGHDPSPQLGPPPIDGGEDTAEEAGPDDDTEIARLAALPLLVYERERISAAKRLGCRGQILDRLVAAERGRNGTDNSACQGRKLVLHRPEPWLEAVEGAALLDDLAKAIRRHVVLSATEAAAAALWVVATHAFTAFLIFARLFITAPEKGCGKSTLLDVLSRLVPRPLQAVNSTAAALFRVVEAERPTLLLDEADSWARDNEDVRSILNAGHRRDGAVIRTVGDDHEPRQFSAWAPVALAAIGHLPGTIEDRSIKIALLRRRPDEAIEQLRLDRTGDLDRLARMAARWAADHHELLRQLDPGMPGGIVNRAADNWRPLLAVADLAGGTWPERARRAAATIEGEHREEDSKRVALLADVRAAFALRRVDKLSSEELVAHLVTLEDRPWPEYRGGKPLTKTQLAQLLKPLRVSPGTVRLADGGTLKGYKLEVFDDAFARFLPARNVTPSQPAECKAESEIPKRHNGSGADGL